VSKEILIAILGIILLLPSKLKSQTCFASAGADTSVCTGEGSQYRVYLDGSQSYVENGSANYEWTVLDDGISISSSQSDEVDPYFKYPDNLEVDASFRIELRVWDNSGSCEDRDTIVVSCFANMCPTVEAGDDKQISRGCNPNILLDGSETEDPENDQLTYSWSSLNGYDSNIESASEVMAAFNFPSVEGDKIFSFLLTVSDGNHSVSDIIRINYLDNDAPIADAGEDISTCKFEFELDGSRSYDAERNELSYQWVSIDGLDLLDSSLPIARVFSPTDLSEATNYRVSLEVNDGYCSDIDTLIITVEANICPVADAGEDIRVPKYDPRSVTLNAGGSLDPDGSSLLYEWISPTGFITNDPTVEVVDQDLDSRYSEYSYLLRVMDSEGALDIDSVRVIFSNFTAPDAPEVFAVADHNRVLVSWDASSEQSSDSLTGYFDFEGYRLYRSTDGGETWGGPDDRLYDFNGKLVGWLPYAQFDFSYQTDINHCIYSSGSCSGDELNRGESISGLDPLSPRFSLGSNTGISYSFIDSNVVDGVEYTYTVTAYDMGLTPFSISYNELDSTDFFDAETTWSSLNPGKFLGPDLLAYYGEPDPFIADDQAGEIQRRDAPFLRYDNNPERGYPSLESLKGIRGEKNFITVNPGYTASNISFPDEKDIEALFTSDSNNIGTGDRDYFIVDRTKIINSRLMYEIQANQGSQAVDEMACEDPLIYAYEIGESGIPLNTKLFYENELSLYQRDSIIDLPGSILNGDTYTVPVYDIISPVGRWSDQFKGIRFRYENALPLNVSSVPTLSTDTLAWSVKFLDEDGTYVSSPEVDSLVQFLFGFALDVDFSYTNITSYNRRLNFDYKIEFFDEPIGDTINVTNANGSGIMGIPFRITNLWTGKKVGLTSNDYGYNNSNPLDFENGASDFTWTRNEVIKLRYDSLKVAGTWIEASNYQLQLNWIWGRQGFNTNSTNFNPNKEYFSGDTVNYKQMLWRAEAEVPFGTAPEPRTTDRDNPWLPAYPWGPFEGLQLIIKPQKFFVDGDKWESDMRILGQVNDIVDSTLSVISVVPNPYMVRSRFNETSSERRIRFTRLPQKCQITIYTVAGELVTSFPHESQYDSNKWWDLTNGQGALVGPGLYIYIVETENKKEEIGKFAIIR